MLRIAALFPKYLWQRKLGPQRKHVIRALQRRSDVELVLTGQGWDNWDDGATAADNLDNTLPKQDAVIWYKPLGLPRHGIAALVEPQNIGCLTIETFNEAWWPSDLAAKQVLEVGTKLVICHHANDIPQFKTAAEAGVRVEHIPHCAEPSIFTNRVGPRDIDVILTGVRSPEIYPLRDKWFQLIKSGKINGKCATWPHPGYWGKSVEDCDAKVAEYAWALQRSKVALVCSSKYKYSLAKYVEAAMAGCCVIGDMPDEAPDGYREFLVPVSADDSLETLAGVVNAALAGGVGFVARRGREAREEAMRNFTMDRYADRLVSLIKDCLPC